MRRDNAAMIDSRLNPVFATDLYLALPKPDVDLMPVNRHVSVSLAKTRAPRTRAMMAFHGDDRPKGIATGRPYWPDESSRSTAIL
jgi:hypothetical protein